MRVVIDTNVIVSAAYWASIGRVVAGDADDDAVIACSYAAQADYIVSGDIHLLSMGAYQGITICTVDDFASMVLPTLSK